MFKVGKENKRMKYVKEELEAMLYQYKENEAKLVELQLKTEEFKERLNYAGTVYQDNENEVIENMQLAGQAYDSIHSNTNKISDKVSTTAMSYKKEVNHINSEDRNYLEKKIQEFEEESNRLNKKVVRVKNLLNRITKEENFVITLYYLEKSKWDYVEKEYFDEFERHKSIKQLQKYRDNALEQMLNIINVGL